MLSRALLVSYALEIVAVTETDAERAARTWKSGRDSRSPTACVLPWDAGSTPRCGLPMPTGEPETAFAGPAERGDSRRRGVTYRVGSANQGVGLTSAGRATPSVGVLFAL